MKVKTISQSISCDAQRAIAYLAEAQNLPRWYKTFCRSVRRDGERWLVQTHRREIPLRLLRDDRSGVVDFLFQFDADFEWLVPSRILANGSHCEFILTLIQPEGTSEGDYHRHLQWAHEAALELKQQLEKTPLAPSVATAVPAAPSPVQEQTPSDEVPEISNGQDTTEEPEGKGPVNPKRMFIRNLPFEWTDEQLRIHFAPAGQVTKAEVARFRRNGRSRGFGFVEMATEEEAKSAIETLHGSLAGTRKITVRLSREGRPEPEPGEEKSAAEKPGHTAKKHTPPQRERKPPRQRPEPRSRPAPAARPAGRRLPGGGDRHAVIETGGYEFFPRGQKGEMPEPGNERPSSPPPGTLNVEGSPYFEDTGDIENRGNRPPRRGSRPPSRGPRGRSPRRPR